MSLLSIRVQRVHFDPKNKAHVASLKSFIETGSWGEVKFACEGSYLSVPEYVMRKFIAHQLKCSDVVLSPAVKASEALAVVDKPVADEPNVSKIEPHVVPLLKLA